MPRIPKNTTALGIVRSASCMGLREFSDLLKIPVRTLQSYILGTRSLPPLEDLKPLGSVLGIDLDSLIKGPPQMIDGGPVTPDGIKNWRMNLGLDEREAGEAVNHLAPVLSAVLKGLSGVDAHRGRLLLTRVCRLVDTEIQDCRVKDAAELILASNPEEEIKNFPTGKEFLDDSTATNQLHKAEGWSRIAAVIDAKTPVQLKILTKRSLDLPWNFMPFQNVGSEEHGTYAPDAVLSVPIRKVQSTYLITQGGIKFEISLDRIVAS